MAFTRSVLVLPVSPHLRVGDMARIVFLPSQQKGPLPKTCVLLRPSCPSRLQGEPRTLTDTARRRNTPPFSGAGPNIRTPALSPQPISFFLPNPYDFERGQAARAKLAWSRVRKDWDCASRATWHPTPLTSPIRYQRHIRAVKGIHRRISLFFLPARLQRLAGDMPRKTPWKQRRKPVILQNFLHPLAGMTIRCQEASACWRGGRRGSWSCRWCPCDGLSTVEGRGAR